ncbi:hypothetical protein C2G38_2212072 [Gigaspora rosea]|uniref:Uncharacterized protein n=1 Tax=Gigaspora rosea TaxID=44941 RepID=A0A397UGR3_9GLOM|nr:hypothetical protein C2G38_2212072 [Gigaspora rosea]
MSISGPIFQQSEILRFFYILNIRIIKKFNSLIILLPTVDCQKKPDKNNSEGGIYGVLTYVAPEILILHQLQIFMASESTKWPTACKVWDKLSK